MLLHYVNSHPLCGPYPPGMEMVQFGMGCFWGAERLFWQQQGVYVTAVGYAGGRVVDPTYQAVCQGDSGHAEVTRVVFDPKLIDIQSLLALFWQSHDPTQGMRQGNDVGTQYRSAIYYYGEAHGVLAEKSRQCYQLGLSKAGFGQITTEISPAPTFYLGEECHQQYLAKNPGGYCGLSGTGVDLKTEC